MEAPKNPFQEPHLMSRWVILWYPDTWCPCFWTFASHGSSLQSQWYLGDGTLGVPALLLSDTFYCWASEESSPCFSLGHFNEKPSIDPPPLQRMTWALSGFQRSTLLPYDTLDLDSTSSLSYFLFFFQTLIERVVYLKTTLMTNQHCHSNLARRVDGEMFWLVAWEDLEWFLEKVGVKKNNKKKRSAENGKMVLDTVFK